MQATIQKIRTALGHLYPPGETESFIRIIFSHFLGYSPTELILSAGKIIDRENEARIDQVIKRLRQYEPLQYILGETEFYGLKIRVNNAVLIPRQETEELVDWILRSEQKEKHAVLDIGTGSGCIALALKKHLPLAEVYAIDHSSRALSVASENALSLGLSINIQILDIFHPHPFEKKFDLIVSNPPYVRESEKKLMHPNVLDFEPTEALFVSDDDPLSYYRAIAEFSNHHLQKDGWIYFEINEAMGEETSELMKEYGFSAVEVRKDLNGKERMLRCKK